MAKGEFAKAEEFITEHKGASIAVVIGIAFLIIAIVVVIFLVYHFWFHSDSTPDDKPLTEEEETKLFSSLAKKMIGTRRYFQLHSIPNAYLDSAAAPTNTVWDITSGYGTAPKGNCFYSDTKKYAVHIDENSYIYLLKDVNASAGVWEIVKVLYDADSSNTHEEPYSLVIDTAGSFTASSTTNFVIKGSTPPVTVKTVQPLLTFGATNANNYRLYIDESTGKLRVRVYGASFSTFEPGKDVEVVTF